jgi:hypothetical protein
MGYVRILRYFLIGFLLLAITAPSFVSSAHAQTPNVVKIGIYVLDIGKFDLGSGSYTVDFYLSLRCDGKCNLGTFEFMNGRASSITVIQSTPNQKFYRILANLYENLDLRNYPFDSHKLTIKMEDTSLTKENLVYQPDLSNSGLDSSIVIVGWKVSGWSSRVVDHYYQPYNQTYSRYIFTITLDRPGYTTAANTFLPVFFLVFVSLISMLLVGKRLETRIILSVTVLLAEVVFQFTLDNAIPPVGYLTFADKFMIATYIIMVSTLVIAIILLKYNDRKDLVKSERIHFYSLRIMPLLTILIYALTFLLFL